MLFVLNELIDIDDCTIRPVTLHRLLPSPHPLSRSRELSVTPTLPLM